MSKQGSEVGLISRSYKNIGKSSISDFNFSVALYLCLNFICSKHVHCGCGRR